MKKSDWDGLGFLGPDGMRYRPRELPVPSRGILEYDDNVDDLIYKNPSNSGSMV